MKYFTQIGDREREFSFERQGDQWLAHSGDKTYCLGLSFVGDGTAFSMLVDGVSHDLVVDTVDGQTLVQVRGEMLKVQVQDERERTASEVAGARAGGKRTVAASMPGVVAELSVQVGDVVEDGQTLLILEAMKMQNPIQAEGAGTVVKIHTQVGEAVANAAPLVDLDEES